jgi:Icc-related predicted phosphoesterase
MKILTVSDTVIRDLLERKSKKDFANLSMILGCGDLPPEYLHELRSRYEVPLYYVLGNHDLRYREAPPKGCTLIDRRLVYHDKLRLLGFSGSRWYNGKINQYSEQQMRSHVRKLWFTLWRSRGVDLIVTHAPPRFIHDAEDLCHRGFRVFNTIIAKYRPQFFVHGHIHADFVDEADRITQVDTTTVINSYGYHVFEI